MVTEPLNGAVQPSVMYGGSPAFEHIFEHNQVFVRKLLDNLLTLFKYVYSGLSIALSN